jgi:hypothetical protein
MIGKTLKIRFENVEHEIRSTYLLKAKDAIEYPVPNFTV